MFRFFLAFLLLVLTAGAAGAQDPPSRVGRLSYIEGTVSFHPADQNAWAPATVNYPVTSGESFWTEPVARAEIQIGPAELRLDQASELDVVRLDDATIDLQLSQGVLNLHLWRMPEGGISVMTPRGRVVVTEIGSYDIDAGRPNGDAATDRVRVTVLEGAARFEGDRGAVEIAHSETAMIGGEPMDVALTEGSYTAFDDWALARERREVAAQQPGYVSPTVTGYQDLNQHGRWTHDPTYGGVWYPADVPSDWAPYRYGHWAFVPPWAWTWIDDAPWGFAPFHYGRWIETGDRWGWVPGALVERPVYAPALVAFVGDNGWGISLSVGAPLAAVGWVALAPNEVYRPYYHSSQTYVRNVNVTNVNTTVINNITVNNTNTTVTNFRNRQATTVVPAAAFTRAAPVQRAAVAVPQEQLAQVTVARSIEHLQPSPAARIGHAAPAASEAGLPRPNAPATVAQTPVVATPQPDIKSEPMPPAPGPHRTDGERRATPATPPSVTAAPAAPRPQQAQSPPALPREDLRARTEPNAAVTPAPPPAARSEATQRRPDPTAAPPTPTPQSAAVPAPARPQPPTPPANAAPTPIPVPHPEQQTRTVPTAAPPASPPAVRSEATQRRPEPTAAPPIPTSQSAAAPAPPPRPQSAAAPVPPAPRPQTAALPPRPQPPTPPANAALTPIPVPHPEQQTHIAPTPQAWTRAPGPPPQPHPAAAPAVQAAHPVAALPPHPAAAPPPAAHPVPAKDERKDRANQ